MAEINLQSVKNRYGIIGRSESLDSALYTALRVANTDLTVLITGESGVGKEVFSRLIHDNSPRKHEKIIAINFGAIPEGTINSELFGHEKGAFTGAMGERKGYFESYDGGTIFLDEIGEMPLDTQALLLRVLENGEFIRVGASTIRTTDVRIIAATNVDLEERIRKGQFRKDLFYRLNTVPIQLPPLRERREDIYLLFRKFAVDFAERYRMTPLQLDATARQLIENYPWPGNIRELRHTAEQLSVRAEERTLDGYQLAELMPQLLQRNLPAPIEPHSGESGFQEREIFYRFLIDMRSDLNDLKGLIFELIRNNDLEVSDSQEMRNLRLPSPASSIRAIEEVAARNGDVVPQREEIEDLPSSVEERLHRPIILNEPIQEDYHSAEVLDDELDLAENERKLIRKALRKHNGRRREAAQDLGISERTLYRKIKEYELNE